jgi:hypothetical protein
MNHAETVARDLPSRYVRRELSEDEERQFEEHLVDCARCLDEIEAIEGLRAGLREQPRGATVRRAPAIWWHRPAVWAAFAASLVLAVTVPLMLSLARQRDDWRNATANQTRLAEEARRSAEALKTRLDRAEQTLSTRPSQTEARVGSIPVLALSLARGPQDPSSRFTIPASARLIVLTVEVDDASAAANYRATLATAAGAPIWSVDGFKASSSHDLGIVVPASSISNGDYILRLERVANGRVTTAGRYRFNVTRAG